MNAKYNKNKADFIRKKEIIENSRIVLKEEFIGIDNIIDDIVDNVSSWYFLSELQEKPVVINLWGLTGVGKTSLVNRLVELIGFEEYYYRFDLGEKEGSFSFRESLNELCENRDSEPVIIALDEIQHSRTVTGPFREEVDNDKNRMIWELIDSGKILHIDWKYGLWSFEDLIEKLFHLLKAGVVVRNGVITKNVNLFCKEMGINKEPREKVQFVPKSEYELILSLSNGMMDMHLHKDVEERLMKLNGEETIKFLLKVLKIGKKPSLKNFSKALIFILGNLDEAYTMSSNFSADIDADEFNKLSLKITVPKIKDALRKRFRNEQIARLGNIHIIYPALSRLAYTQIINKELFQYSKNLNDVFDIEIVFDGSINEIIYKEGVYPTQGVRPIFTSIHQIIKSKISVFFSEIYLRSVKVNCMLFHYEDKTLICKYLFGDKEMYEYKVEVKTALEDVRKVKKDDIQAITAVHESGHAVISIVLMNTIPEVIYSVTSDSDSNGFLYSSYAWKYISRKELIPRVAMMLGGYVAEEIIFGKENLTAGASSDIEKATEFLSDMFKNSGMGSNPIKYSIPVADTNDMYHNYKGVENEINETIKLAIILAEETLRNEKKLLLALSNYLSDCRMLRKEEIRKISDENLQKGINYIDNGDHLFYRNHLKKQVLGIEGKRINLSNLTNPIYLNKDSKEI